MPGHHALGPTGGAAGEHQVGGAVGVQPRLALVHRGRCDSGAAGEVVGPGDLARTRAAAADDDHRLQGRRTQPVEHRG